LPTHALFSEAASADGGNAGIANIEHAEASDRIFNRLARTFTTQMETLKRYRMGGMQTVTVQHVSVSEGGQAIVGNVTQDVRESAAKKSANKPSALTNSRQQPMPIIEERQIELVPARRRQKDDGQSSA
jgi:hypothetical protein